MVELLYSKYYTELLGYCLSLTHDRQLSEDVVQEAFLRALANCGLLGELSEPKCRAWLYRTARNIFIDHMRRRSHEGAESEDEPVFEDGGYSSVMVSLLCSRLPESERTLFIMRYLEGYNSSELGEMFGLPPPTVRARLASARSKLREIVKEN